MLQLVHIVFLLSLPRHPQKAVSSLGRLTLWWERGVRILGAPSSSMLRKTGGSWVLGLCQISEWRRCVFVSLWFCLLPVWPPSSSWFYFLYQMGTMGSPTVCLLGAFNKIINARREYSMVVSFSYYRRESSELVPASCHSFSGGGP